MLDKWILYRWILLGEFKLSVIKQALAKLDTAVGKLDGATHGLEKNGVGQQSDMFNAPSNENENEHTIDGAVIAQRLDQAIEKVETILKDGVKN